ncbi:MAG: hypothetical protein VX367_02380 [SAR324 cluster bacterium]|nr:hypothetical protein [SAR324 cluster bacterium]
MEFKNVTDGRTDRPTYRPTDTARCRVACPRLKTNQKHASDEAYPKVLLHQNRSYDFMKV